MVTQICEIPDNKVQDTKNTKNNNKPTKSSKKPTCMFCQKQAKTIYELTFKNMKNGKTTQQYYCKDCLDQLKDLVRHLDDIPEMPEPASSKYSKYIGQTLKEFLCTDMYLKTETEIIFFDKHNQEIKEFTEWLKHVIYNIIDEKDFIKIVLE